MHFKNYSIRISHWQHCEAISNIIDCFKDGIYLENSQNHTKNAKLRFYQFNTSCLNLDIIRKNSKAMTKDRAD